jgi:3-oxoacyl-[acyl-carrier protein] reductase
MRYSKTAIITGANGQTAVYITRELLRQDCKLLLMAHQRTERIEQLKAEFPNSCHLVKCDLNSIEQTNLAIKNWMTETGLMPEALIHTAAIRSYDAKTLSESNPEIWKCVITQNITFAYHVLRCVLPVMIKAKKGKIVLFGSNVTRTGLPFGSAYAAGKAALANLVRTVAWEVAPHNIQINMISPAPIETNLAEDYQDEYLVFRQEYFEAYRKSHPAGKLVSPEDVSQTVLSLLNFNTNSISGEEIFLTGGVL